MNIFDTHFQKVNSGQVEYFSCPVNGCKKAFLYKSEVERHQITHNNSKPYACTHEDCEKSFKRQDALRVHMQTHSAEPQFFCSIPGCEAKFKAKPALKYHLSKHHVSELKQMTNSPGLQCTLLLPKTPRSKSKEILAKREFSYCETDDSFPQEEWSPCPTKYLFLEAAETRSNSSIRSTRTIRQEIINNPDDKELKELKSLLKCLAKENKELKSKFDDDQNMKKEPQDLENKFTEQMTSFFKTDTFLNNFFE